MEQSGSESRRKRKISQELRELCAGEPDRWSDNRDRRVCQHRKMVGGYYICLMVSYPRGSGHFSTDSGVFGPGNGSLQVLCREQGLSGGGF